MAPTYHWGDLIIVDTTADTPVHTGDVVTVRRPTGVLYTHRVIDITTQGAITTQGDANPTPDTPTITRTDIIGTVTTHIPQPWARLLTTSQSLPGRLSLGALLIGLLLIPATTRRRRDTNRHGA